MPIPGLNADNCARRNYTAATRDKVNSVPVKFLRGSDTTNLYVESAGNRGGVGKMPKNESEALAMINAVAPRAQKGEPLTSDDVYIHYMEAANDNFIPDRFMFLDPETTLKNIALDAQRGFAFMNSHRTGGLSHPAELPFGRSFAGRFEKVTEGEGDDATTRTRTIIGIYMLKGEYPNGANGPSTDALSRGIDAGTIFDVSVGLWGGQSLCDICGGDVDDWYDCDHIPGTHHGMDDIDEQMQKDRGVPDGVASYTLYNAGCGETSSVYDGAVPGAGFAKAMKFAKGNTGESEILTEIANAYPKLLQGGTLAHSNIAETILSLFDEGGSPITTPKGNDSMSGTHGQTTAPKPSTRRGFFGMGQAQDTEADAITVQPFVQLSPDQYTALTSRAETAERERDEAKNHPVLSAALAAGIDTADKFAALNTRAGYGDKYSESVASELSKQAVRRFGQDKAVDKVRVYSKLPLEDQKEAAAMWKQEADDKFNIKGKDGNGTEHGAERKTAVSAEGFSPNGSGTGSAWDKLTAEEQQMGTRLGADTEDKKEKFAKTVVDQRGGK